MKFASVLFVKNLPKNVALFIKSGIDAFLFPIAEVKLLIVQKVEKKLVFVRLNIVLFISKSLPKKSVKLLLLKESTTLLNKLKNVELVDFTKLAFTSEPPK